MKLITKHLTPRIGLITATGCLAASSVTAFGITDFDLIPQPKHIEIVAEGNVLPTHPEPAVSFVAAASGWRPEQYSVSITPDSILITAADKQGAVWASRTLAQLRRPDGTYPQVRITDYPEFPIRGFLYDDGRNFAGVDRIKEYLDLMSEYKLNVFQWHLTDKPAWRIESRCHPILNDGRFQRPGRDQGCYYTYDQIREVFDYAAQRGILVIPEIDMPGHSDFFRTAFGFTMETEEGRKVLEECLSEFFDEIPRSICPYVHIGSDEVHISNPKEFMDWAQTFVRKNGRRTLCWDPGLDADSLTIRQFWRDGNPGKIEYPKEVPFVDSGMGYLNYYDPLLMPAKIYFHTPCGKGYADDCALGGIICLWNDVRASDKDLVAPHSGMAGGIMAFAERFWNGGATADKWVGTILPEAGSDAMSGFEEFQRRMSAHKDRWLGRELSYWDPVRATPWQLEISADSVKASFEVYGDVLDLNELCARRGIGPDIMAECRLTRTIECAADTVARYRIGFDAPARSNRVSDGIPAQGQWENFGLIKVNGQEVLPPVWREPGLYRYHYNTWAKPEEELPYTDEQLYWMREPISVPLKKGSNIVSVSLRRHFKGQRFQFGFVEAR